MRYTTVIFDLDGTLLNTLEDIRDSVNYTLRSFGFPEKSLEEVRMSVGNASAWLIERSLPDGRNTPKFDEILDFYTAYYNEHSAIKTAPYDGVCQMLRKLAAKEYKLAVVSNKPDATVKRLVRKFFGDTISVAIGERKGVRRKPEPDTVKKAMEELFSFTYECVYVGDSEVDLETAKNAGIDCISVSWGFRSRDLLVSLGAENIADSPTELLKLV